MLSRQPNTDSPLPDWYQSYFTAVLEPDETKALHQIERAATTITERLDQLRNGAQGCPQEFQDLNGALTYLRLLSENIDPELRGWYDVTRIQNPTFS